MQQIDADAVRWRRGEHSAGERDSGEGDLLVVLHGLGSHEGDLFGLAPHLPASLTIASLRAPLPYGGGFAWFDPAPIDRDERSRDASAEGVLQWLDGLDRRFERVHLLGFSQGGVMAVQLARLAPERFSSIVHLASFVHDGQLPGDAVLAARAPRIPMLTTIGDLDDVIHRDRIERATPWLDAHFDVERRTYHRAHSIVAEELADVVAFLERV